MIKQGQQFKVTDESIIYTIHKVTDEIIEITYHGELAQFTIDEFKSMIEPLIRYI